MMKNWKKIAVLLVVLVIFVAAFIFLTMNQGKPGTPDNTASPTVSPSASIDEVELVDIARDDISKIILKREDGDIVLTKEEREIEKLNQKSDGTTEKVKEKVKVWVTSAFDVDSSKVDDIALAADTATTGRLIEENPKDITIYGLDKALVTTFASADGREISLEIGDKTPTGDKYYVRKAGTLPVYTLDSYKGDSLRLGKFDIMNKNLYGSEALTIDDMTAMALTKNGGKVFEAKQSGDSEWQITAPVERKADLNELSKFLSWLVEFRVSDYIEENPANLKTYGLDKPLYVFDFTLGGKTYSLKLGTLKESSYYAQMDGNPVVFTISSSTLTFVDTPVIDLLDTFVYIPTIYDVEKLVIELDGRVDELLIKSEQEDTSKEEFTFNGKKMEGDDNVTLFKRYYQGAIGISGEKLDLTATPSGKAFAKLTYTMEEAKPDKIVTIELIPTQDGYGYYLVKNGQYTGMVMGERKLDDESMGIRPAYKNLMDGLAKTP